jgi:hypothetical protein
LPATQRDGAGPGCTEGGDHRGRRLRQHR